MVSAELIFLPRGAATVEPALLLQASHSWCFERFGINIPYLSWNVEPCEDFISGGFWSTHLQLHKSRVDVPLWVMKMEKYLGFGARSPQRWVPPLPNSGARMDVTLPPLSHLFAYVIVKMTVYKKGDCIVLLRSYWKDYNPGLSKRGIRYHGRLFWEEIFVSFVRHSPNGEDLADRLSIPPWWRD